MGSDPREIGYRSRDLRPGGQTPISRLPVGNITPQPVVDYLASLRRDPHERLALIDREGRSEGLPLVYPDTGALLHTLARGCGAARILRSEERRVGGEGRGRGETGRGQHRRAAE